MGPRLTASQSQKAMSRKCLKNVGGEMHGLITSAIPRVFLAVCRREGKNYSLNDSTYLQATELSIRNKFFYSHQDLGLYSWAQSTVMVTGFTFSQTAAGSNWKTSWMMLSLP